MMRLVVATLLRQGDARRCQGQ